MECPFCNMVPKAGALLTTESNNIKCSNCGEWSRKADWNKKDEKQELSHFGLCDVNGCHKKVVGTHDGSDFCEEHLARFYTNEVDPVDGTSLHPLLNPSSPHYSMVDGVEAIERMEQMYGTLELMHWSKITAMKYRLRIGKKDSVEGDAKKIATYEAYYEYLGSKL